MLDGISLSSVNGGIWSINTIASPGFNSMSIKPTNFGGNWSFMVADQIMTGDVVAAIIDASSSLPANFGAISTPGDMNEFPDVAVNNNGQAIAVWRNITTPTAAFIEASIFNGTSWSAPEQISATGNSTTFAPYNFDFPKVGIGACGNGVATWGRFDSTTSTHYIESAAYSQCAGIWSSVVTIDSLSAANQALLNMDLDMNEQRGAIAIWAQVDTDPDLATIVRASTLLTTIPIAPTNLTKCCIPNQFLTQSVRIKIISWDASPSPDIVSYRVSRNGKVVAIVPANGKSSFCYKDHNRQNCVDTYRVRAIASDGSVGDAATVRF